MLLSKYDKQKLKNNSEIGEYIHKSCASKQVRSKKYKTTAFYAHMSTQKLYK